MTPGKRLLPLHLWRGRKAERIAQNYLISHGLHSIVRNYRCKSGEIDIVMQQENYVVFIEVRYRSNVTHGTAAESITAGKRIRLRQAAEHYLQRHPHLGSLYSRFDVITLTGSLDKPEINWIRDAF